MQGERRDQIRGRELRPGDVQAVLALGLIIPGYFDASVYGAVGAISAIDPDDAAAAGVSTALARADHQHANACAPPSALTRTTTNTEGGSSSFARSDHGHSTADLSWGVMSPRFSSTSNSSAYGDLATTDHALANIATLSTRLYKVCNKASAIGTAGDRWLGFLYVEGAFLDKLFDVTIPGSGVIDTTAAALWAPATGTLDIDIRLDRLSGSGTFTLAAGDPTGTTRQFWVEDIGPR